MSDPSKKPLKIPNSYIPYLEKHKIFDIFHEIARELVIQKPDDHVLFTKQMLLSATQNVNTSRIILLCSPRINCTKIAKEIAKVTNQVILTEEFVLEVLKKPREEVDWRLLIKTLVFLIRTKHAFANGWILADFIHTEQDAKRLIQAGVLPTHVIHLVAPFHNHELNLSDLFYCNVPENWPKYRRNITALRKIYAKILVEVHVGAKNISQIVKACVNVTKTRESVKQVKPRVVLLGPRGSGRKSQANLLCQTMGLVHVDFEYLLCQVWTNKTDLSEKLGECGREVCFHSEILCQVINQRILKEDCLQHGWVLTGFPYTETDFKFLDTLDTPPNRVIFLECEISLCKERITGRKTNAYTGSQTDILHSEPPKHKILNYHPRDNNNMLNAELAFYCQHSGKLRKYCGDTAIVVNGEQDARWVHECITAYIVRTTLNGAPRKGLTVEQCEGSCECLKVPSGLTGFVTNI